MAASHNSFLNKDEKVSLQGGSHSLDNQGSLGGSNGGSGTAEEVQEIIYQRINPRFACRMRTRLTKL